MTAMRKIVSAAMRVLSRKELPLFESLMGLIILSFFWVLWVGGVFHSSRRSKLALNDHRIILLKMALLTYEWANASFPPDLGVLACEGQDRRTCIPLADPTLVSDAWGTPYIYEASGREFTIKSLGADKREGGKGADADIVSEGP